ncbi:MAG: DUF819 family protein [Pirellulales bacterium]|nr:DUF819 family protein [Pirellulales bacterium]
MAPPLISNPIGVLAVLTGVVSFFFLLERRTQWRLFRYFPPLLFIYAVPLLLSNIAWPVIPRDAKAPVYQWMDAVVLPMLLIFMLLNVDIRAAVRVMGRGFIVMLMGTAGVVIGAPIAYWLVKNQLDPDGWKAFAMLSGSWIGGSANMAAVARGLEPAGEANSPNLTMAIMADTVIYAIWIPILLIAKDFAGWFSRVAKVDPDRVARLESMSGDLGNDKGKLEMRHVIYLLFLGLVCAWLGTLVKSVAGGIIPADSKILTPAMCGILTVTTLGILLSLTPARTIPGSHEMGVALVYFFVANMGAQADLSRVTGQAAWFVGAAILWIFIHGGFCLLGAWMLRVDIHTAAIASAANIGGVGTATVVSTHHNEKLVPVAVLMALIGYSIGNYCAPIAGKLCELIQ